MGKESQLYPLIQNELKEKFKQIKPLAGSYHLELTYTGKFSEKLKREVKDDIVFSFLKKRASPDITGFLKSILGTDFITVEVKRKGIVLDDIYQAKKYADLFRAKYGFLLSSEPIPEEIKRLSRTTNILVTSEGRSIKIAQYNEKNGKILDRTWFPENPFEEW